MKKLQGCETELRTDCACCEGAQGKVSASLSSSKIVDIVNLKARY